MDAPNVPGGVNHRLSDNYYYERDARRQVAPPEQLYEITDAGQTSFGNLESTEGAPYVFFLSFHIKLRF